MDNNQLDNQTCQNIFDALPLGLVLVKQDHTIHFWNHWMEQNTQIPAQKVIGQPLQIAFKGPLSPRFEWALQQALNYHHPQVLSTTLNQFILPIPISKGAYGNIEKMQQDVEVLPLHHGEEDLALVVIQDASVKAHLKNTLMSIAARFEKSSFIDTLTGCYNRRLLFKYLDAELKKAKRYKYNVACCLYDIDYFKRINDTFGHDAGDEVLVSFSSLAQSILRPNDYFFRYGGEEFISISSDISQEEALSLTNCIRTELEKKLIPCIGSKKLTVSGGLSYWTPESKGIDAEKLISLADIQLYKAKEEGRNQIKSD